MSTVTEYYFKEGCYIEEWQNNPNDPELSIARVRVLPHQTTKLHALKNTIERYVILSGQAIVTLGDVQQEVGAKDVIVIPAEQAQKIQNVGNQDLVFLAICTPRFVVENYYECE